MYRGVIHVISVVLNADSDFCLLGGLRNMWEELLYFKEEILQEISK